MAQSRDERDSESGDEYTAEVEQTIWEPQPPSHLSAHPPSPQSSSPLDGPAIPTAAEREAAGREARHKTFVVPFKAATAGAPIPAEDVNGADGTARLSYKSYGEQVGVSAEDNPYHPFGTRLEWEVARWAKLRGSGSTAFSDLLAIEGVRHFMRCAQISASHDVHRDICTQIVESLRLSFKNSRELDAMIDTKLPSARPQFKHYEILVAGEAVEGYFRDILECIRSLYGDPEFAPLLLLVPEKHYTNKTCNTRVYFDMNTGKWWWATQVSFLGA